MTVKIESNRKGRFLTPSLETLPRLALLTGPAGIGKTHYLLENFARLLRESKNPLLRDILYLLPTAEHRERIVDLMLRKEKSGFFGDRVTTLNRLMRELLKAGDIRLATDAERWFLVGEILSQIGEGYFSSVADLPGFLEKMSDFLGELKESMVSLESFREGMEHLARTRPEIRAKYEGLLQIYERYEGRLTAQGIRDHRDGLFLLKEAESQRSGKRPRFHYLFVDGFFDFSKAQLEFLGWLAKRSERMVLALTLDLSPERQGLFETPLKTLKELERLGFQTVDLSEAENRRASTASLCHLERNLFRESVEEKEAQGALFILEATGIRGEVEMIAREIRRLIRRGGVSPPRQGEVTSPLHFSDIAIILRRIGIYEPVIRAVFRDFRIPVEIHERERLRDAPLARTLVSFFKVLLEDWERGNLFNFLKSSYVEKDFAEVCAVQLRGFDLGIVSGRERWVKEVGGALLEKMNDFQERFQGERSVNEWIRLTEEVMESFGLTRIPERYEERSRRDWASLKRLRALLEEIRHSSASRGAATRSFESFAQEFLGLVEVDLFSLHHRDKNRVQVYDVSLARQKEYKVVFLAGLLEEGFPLEIREDPILSDEERRLVGLEERLPRQAVERYFFYLGLTRARSKIILSYPRFDLEGHEALPSFYVDEVRRLFREPLPARSYGLHQSLPRMEDAVEEREVEAHLIKRLYEKSLPGRRSERAFTLGLYNRLVERPSFQGILPRILFDPVARIENASVRAGFAPEQGIFRPTGLELYARCPYRYFASGVLGLEETEEGIDAKQVGILLHEVLESYWRERTEKGNKELELPEQAKRFVRKRLREFLAQGPLSGDRRYRVELKQAQMEEWLCRLVEKEIGEGGPLEPFRPRYVELEFGFRGGKLDLLKLYDPHREDLKLRGKIDRIDVDPSGTYGLVIDYKTGSKFERKELEFGTALQLPLYLLAIQKLLKLKPVGAQIYQINEAKASGFYSKEGVEASGAQPRSRALLDQKEFGEILERAVRFSFQFAGGIARAEIPVRPRDCDDRCPFPALCRIEKWRLPFIYQEIQEEDRKSGLA